MNNALNKILVVFITASSLGFGAFTLSLVSGGPNWRAESEADDFTNDFVIEVAPGDKPTYKVKDRRTNAAVTAIPDSKVLPDVIVAGRKKQAEAAKAEVTRLITDIEKYKAAIAEHKAVVALEPDAMVVRSTTYDKVLSDIHEQINSVSVEYTAKTTAVKGVQLKTEERRVEGYRAKNQLELARTDLFAAEQQVKILEDELARAETNLQRLERRNDQLKQQTEPYEGKSESDAK